MRHLALRLCLALFLLGLSIGIGQAQGQEEEYASRYPKAQTELRKRLGFSISPLPQIDYEHPLHPRILLTADLGMSFSLRWSYSSSSIFDDEGYEERDRNFFSGFVPVVRAGLRYYPFQISSSWSVPNRGIYAEVGGYAVLNPLRLFPSGDYRSHASNHISITPHLLLGFRAQIFSALALDCALGPSRAYDLGADTDSSSRWRLTPRFSIGITL